MKNNVQFLVLGILLLAAFAGVVWLLLSNRDAAQHVTTQSANEGDSATNDPSPPALQSPSRAKELATSDTTAPAVASRSELPADDSKLPSGSGAIEGVVIRLDDGSPVADAQIVVEYFKEGTGTGHKPTSGGQWTAKSDAQGGFFVTDLPVMEAFPERISGFNVTASLDDASAATITALHRDEPHAVVELTLRPTAAIAGRVIDEAGAPLEGAIVTPYEMIDGSSWDSSQSAGLSWCETDETGHFHLEHLPLGKWKLAATAERYALAVSEPIDTGASDAEIVLGRGVSVSGTVLDSASGAPVPGVAVIIAAVELPWRSEPLQSSEDGSFIVESLPDGHFQIHIADKIRVQTGETPVFAIDGGAPVNGLTILVAEGASIRGSISETETGAPIEGVELHAWPDGAMYLERDLSATSDAEGHYEITGLPGGRYTLDLLRTEGYVADQIREGRVVSVTLGESLEGADFLLQRGVTLSGTAVDESGEPVVGLEVSARSNSGNGESGRTAQGGQFTVRGLPLHTQVTLEASGRGYTTTHQEPINTGEAGVEGLTLTVEKGASISGIVVDGGGAPVSEAYVSATSENNGTDSSELTEPDGTFKLTGMKAGVYQLEAESMESVNSGKATEQEVTVEKGESLTGLRIVLDRTPEASISGSVTDAKGQPIEGAWVNANAIQAESHGFAESGVDGLYEVAVEAGLVYRLEVDHSDYSTEEREGIAAGELDVNFTLEGHGTVEGQVLDGATGEPITNFEVAHTSGFSESYDFNYLSYVAFFNAEGRFSLPDVEVGETTVHVRAAGYGPGLQELADVKAGESTTGVQFRLLAGASLEGRVADEGGAPVQGAQIHIGNGAPVYFLEEGFQEAAATSDAEGHFKVDSLGEGPLSVTATHTTFPSATIEVTLEPGATKSVEIVLAAGGTVEGTVMANGSAVANQDVFLQTDNLADIRSATTDAAGFYSIPRISPGEVSLSASVELEGTTRHQEKAATVTANATTTLDFDVAFGSCAIEGTITMGGQPVVEAYISAVLAEVSDGLPVSVDGTVSSDGTYRIAGLDAGAYKLTVHTGGLGDDPGKSRVIDASVGEGEILRVDIDLSGGAHVRGVVSGFSNADLCHVIAVRGKLDATDFESLMTSPEMEAGTAGESSVGASGAYDISGLEPGEYTLIVFQIDMSDPENSPVAAGQVTIDESGVAELNLTFP